MGGIAWALVAAVGFGVTQTMNRKSNQLVDAYRTAFGLLVAVELVLVARGFISGDFALLENLTAQAWFYFTAAALIHFVVGWTLIALSQQRIGVARTGALVSAAPLVGVLLALPVLGESFTIYTLAGVLGVVAGVVAVSLSSPVNRASSIAGSWMGLSVALLWGTSPLLIRLGLETFDSPLLGLTVGLGSALVIFAAGLLIAGPATRTGDPRMAIGWMALGGLTGAVAIGAQWISFGLTTVAVAITVQQLAVIVVLALVPMMFHEPLEKINTLLVSGIVAMLAGTLVVVLAGL
jgi:drug/metabolite transporter (DMT)-like permease